MRKKQTKPESFHERIARILAEARHKPKHRKPRIRYRGAIISYLDILGFKNLVDRRSAAELYDVLRRFRTAVALDKLEAETVPLRAVTFSDLSVRVAFVPDEDRPGTPDGYVYWELLGLALTQIGLISDHILVRGAVAFGEVYCASGVLFGPGIVQAYTMETKAEYPRIVVSKGLLATIHRAPFRSRSHSVREEEDFIEDVVSDDDDGQSYLDYLRVAQSDLEPEEFVAFLEQHRNIITSADLREDRIRRKYDWLRNKHNAAIEGLPEEFLAHYGLTVPALRA